MKDSIIEGYTPAALAESAKPEPRTFAVLQQQSREWAQRNFGDTPALHCLLGVVEEVGELAHAELKSIQGIRGTPEQHAAKAKDAVGDVLIYLADYCNRKGFDFQAIVEETADHVFSRDWKADPMKGGFAPNV